MVRFLRVLRRVVLEPLDIFSLLFDLIFLHASLFSEICISCERFYAIYWPLKHRTLSTRAYAIVISFIRTLAILVGAFFFKVIVDFLPVKTGSSVMTILPSFFFAHLMLW